MNPLNSPLEIGVRALVLLAESHPEPSTWHSWPSSTTQSCTAATSTARPPCTLPCPGTPANWA